MSALEGKSDIPRTHFDPLLTQSGHSPCTRGFESGHLPARTVVVQLNTWREELYRKGVLDREAKSPSEEFRRVRQRLEARSLIGIGSSRITGLRFPGGTSVRPQ